MNVLKFYARKMLGLPVQYYFKRAPVPAVTHLPVLMAMGRSFPIEHVLEFGAGKFSTLSFLDRKLFPHVKSVRSLETDPEWKQRIESLTSGDPRLSIELIDEDVPRTAAACDFTKYDLVFIDNGPNRAETIREVIRHQDAWKLVLIHDFENLPYQQAANAARHKFCFDAYCPHTAVLWNERKLGSGLRANFRRMNRSFASHANDIDAGDVEQWTGILAELVPQSA